MGKVVVISGYFNVLHRGHCEYVKKAKEFAGDDGLVYVIVNSDKQSHLKKGFSFVPEDDRLAVMQSLKYVDKAFLSIDTDRTVCKTIQMLCDTLPDGEKPTHFANGGDVTPDSPCPEEPICVQNGIGMVYNLGDKVQSSSWILDKSVKEAYHILFKNAE